MCAVSPVVHTSNISRCQKKNFFHFSCGCENNSVKVGPLAFFLQMFVIMENIMKRPVVPKDLNVQERRTAQTVKKLPTFREILVI